MNQFLYWVSVHVLLGISSCVNVCFSMGKSMSKQPALLAEGKCQWGIVEAVLSLYWACWSLSSELANIIKEPTMFAFVVPAVEFVCLFQAAWI